MPEVNRTPKPNQKKKAKEKWRKIEKKNIVFGEQQYKTTDGFVTLQTPQTTIEFLTVITHASLQWVLSSSSRHQQQQIRKKKKTANVIFIFLHKTPLNFT